MVIKVCSSAALFFLAIPSGTAAAFAPTAPQATLFTSRFPGENSVVDRPKNHVESRSSLAMISGEESISEAQKAVLSAFAVVSFAAAVAFSPSSAIAESISDSGASSAANAKITTGGASTLQSGRTIAITRGVNLDGSDFGGQNLKGVAFQQSIVRNANFKGTNLYGSSFFDATLDGSDFEGADMTLSNVEMAQFNRANLKNAVVREMYVSGATLFDGIKDIEGSDWTDTMLRKDQKKLLCNHPTAKGTNPTTGVDTRESLMCLD